MFNPYNFIKPLIFLLKPEQAHKLTIMGLKTGLMPGVPSKPNPALEVDLWGVQFPNPVGLAAGFDKNAEVIGPCLKLGFGFVEIGTVTPRPQHGNPLPRIFRDPAHEAVINRMGFPGAGMKVFKNNLEKFLGKKTRPRGLIGINIGMNKNQTVPEKDYTALISRLGPLADYIAVNISSPNTPGLRDLQAKAPLSELLGKLKEQRARSCGAHPPPLLVKFAPDLDEKQQRELAETVMEAGIDGMILTNTTLARPDNLPRDFAQESGGLSGKPLEERATEMIRNIYTLTKGTIPIIGVGGVSDARSAYKKIRAGASLVQLYSSLVFQGPFVAYSINKGLTELLKADGFTNISEAVGADSAFHERNGNRRAQKKAVDGAR